MPHSSVVKLPHPLPPEIPSLSECVRRCKINPPSRRPVGLFGFPASAMILNNAIAKPMLGWEKSPGASRPRPDLAEGAFAWAALVVLAQLLELGKEDCTPEAAGFAPRAWRESVRGLGVGMGSATTCFPVLGAQHLAPQPCCWPHVTCLSIHL